MADTTTGIPQTTAGAQQNGAPTPNQVPENGTLPQTPTTPIPAAQDLQINLEEDNKTSSQEVIQATEAIEKDTQTELDLDLDLDLPEAPNNDDRLKQEDQKNKEEAQITKPVIEEVAPVIQETTPGINEPVIENIPVIEEAPVETNSDPIIEEVAPVMQEATPIIETIIEPVIENIPVIEEAPIETTIQPTIEEVIPVIEETTPAINEPVIENIPVIEEAAPVIQESAPQAATRIETEQDTATAGKELANDMNMISELESHASAGGSAPEAIVPPQAAAPTEQPKTFNLDEMFSTPPQPVETVQQPAPTPMEAQTPTITPPQSVEEVAVPNQPQTTPPFTIPTAPVAPQAPIQTTQTIATPPKNTSVKILLFGVLFAALGFATFFILKTMYPIEFANMFGGTGDQALVQDLSETELTGDMLSGAELSGELLSGEIIDTGTGSHESALDNPFGELNDLTTTETAPAQTDVSRLTDYVNQGNDFLAQGKAMGNNTVIKYGVYISKKATSLLEKIANGEEIDNMSGYFAQFDQYLTQLKEIIGQSSTPTQDSISATPSTNDFETTQRNTNNQYTGE